MKYFLRNLAIVVTVSLSISGLSGCDNMLRWEPVRDDGRSTFPSSSDDYVVNQPEETHSTMASSDSAQGVQDGDYYIVAPGDTLYSIAFRFGFDFRRLAALNGIPDPYIIQPGQRLLVVQNVIAAPQSPSAVPNLPRNQAPSASVPSEAVRNVSRFGAWQQPTAGIVIGRYGQTPSTKNGIHIAGKLGQSVVAANAGQVVYVGNSLKGYGNLIILKHNDEFISAYGFNQSVLVKKDQRVRAGQAIAKMGTNAQNRVLLHFEIRQNGQPVDPQRYITK